MIAQALDETDEIVRKITKSRGACEQGHASVLRERRDAARDPVGAALPVNRCARLPQQAAAELRRLIAEDHAGAARGGGQAPAYAAGRPPANQSAAERA